MLQNLFWISPKRKENHIYIYTYYVLYIVFIIFENIKHYVRLSSVIMKHKVKTQRV